MNSPLRDPTRRQSPASVPQRVAEPDPADHADDLPDCELDVPLLRRVLMVYFACLALVLWGTWAALQWLSH